MNIVANIKHAVASFFNYAGERSLENPAVSLSDPSAFETLGIGARPVAAGVRVDRKQALTLDTWWRGVNLISNTVARLPLYVYRGTRDGNATVDRKHKAFDLIHRRPNEVMTAYTFWQTMMAHTLNHGNAYAAIYRDETGTPVDLLILPPDKTFPVRYNGKLWYVTRIDSSIIGTSAAEEERQLKPEDLIHLKGLGFDGLQGYTAIEMAAEALGLGLGSREYSARFFGNNAEPRVVIEVPGPWKPEVQQEFLRQWHQMHQGLENSHRTALLTGGAKVSAFSLDAEKSQLVESRKLNIREVANFLCLPPHKLGDDSRTAYNSLEQENKAFLSDCMAPWLVMIEQELQEKLLTENQKAGYTHYMAFDRGELERADENTEAQALATKTSNGLMSRDEARARLNLPPLPDGLGEIFTIPANIVPLEDPEEVRAREEEKAQKAAENSQKLAETTTKLAETGTDDAETPQTVSVTADSSARDSALHTLCLTQCRIAVKRLKNDAMRAAKTPQKFVAWIDGMGNEHRAGLRDILGPIAAYYAVTSGVAEDQVNCEADGAVESVIDAVRGELLELAGQCRAAELASRVEALTLFSETQGAEIVARQIGGVQNVQA